MNKNEISIIYVAKHEDRGDDFDIKVTYDLDEARNAVELDMAHLTAEELKKNPRYWIEGYAINPNGHDLSADHAWKYIINNGFYGQCFEDSLDGSDPWKAENLEKCAAEYWLERDE